MASEAAHPAVVVDLGGYKLERHVQRAFQEAWQGAAGRPLSAAHLLQAAVHVGGSEAFTTIGRLLPASGTPPAVTKVAPADLNAIALERPLADSFSVAESFLAANGRAVWGRDFVTLALLADDPSLEALASEAGTSVDDVRAAWRDFVHGSRQHRPPEEWDRWWRAAGALPPQAGTAGTTTDAYLLTWNPGRFAESAMADLLERGAAEGSVTFGWSSGNNRSMRVGDRVFLLRQGEPGQRGLCGVGTVTAPPEAQPHWDPQRRAAGDTSLIVQVRWEAIAVTPMIELSSLVGLTGESQLWTTRVGGVTIDPTVRDRLEGAWRSAWERHAQGLEPAVHPELAPRRLIARFDPDVGAASDSLNIDRYVDAFARVAASRALVPPLSVGLFGDWGSGKTFFMDRLHDRIAQLAAGGDAESEALYLRNVCQIRFNAWHYAETDLWASLVSTVFKELRGYLDGPSEDADEFNKLLNQLEIATELREEAQRRLEDATDQLDKAQASVAEAERALQELPPPEPPSDEALRRIMGSAAADVAGASSEELSDLLRDAYEFTGNERFKDLEAAAGDPTVAEVTDLLDETRAVVTRAGFWWRLLTTARIHRTGRFWAVIGVAVAILVGAIAVESWLAVGIGWAAVLAETLTLGGALVAHVRSTLSRAGPALNRLDTLQTAIERRVEEARAADTAAYERTKAAAEQREREATRAVAAAQAAVDAATGEVQAAEAALRESTSTARLGRFIRERASSADYDKYLGLIAMIHRDFEQLSTLMSGTATNDADVDLPRVDRIVLYIDDLDRCYPPAKVVRVLEAVHLLLFFPLFVVFVGVDSRWVSRALNRYYDQMLSDESLEVDVDGMAASRAPADSQDFLEKIFQVPFWLRRMDPTAVQRMIHQLISPDEVGPGPGPPDAWSDDGGAPPQPDEEELAPAPGRAAAGKGAARRTTHEAEGGDAFVGEPAAPPTEALRISETELSFMDEVAPLMPRTPRSVKRFVNIYRLYKAALSTAGLAKFLGTPGHPGNFRAVQILLALVIGAPDFAQAVVTVIDDLDGAGSQRLSDLPRLVAEPHQPTWEPTLAALATFAQGDNNLSLEALREIAPLVSRYSVHHMVSELPGESTLE